MKVNAKFCIFTPRYGSGFFFEDWKMKKLMKIEFDNIEKVIKAFRQGKMIIVTDDENRENSVKLFLRLSGRKNTTAKAPMVVNKAASIAMNALRSL